MVTHLADCHSSTIFKALCNIFLYYFQQGFQITGVMGDGEFALLQEFMVELPAAPCFNLASANEHKPFVEHRIHVIKERAV